jgi:hypothetical protein
LNCQQSGKSGTVHIEQVLEYNEDPRYLRDSLLYKLTLEAQQRLEKSALSKREIIRQLGASATQFFRLLDQTNYRKSVSFFSCSRSWIAMSSWSENHDRKWVSE